MANTVSELELKFTQLMNLFYSATHEKNVNAMAEIKATSADIDRLLGELPAALPLNVSVKQMLDDVSNQKRLVESYLQALSERAAAIEEEKQKNFDKLKNISADFLGLE